MTEYEFEYNASELPESVEFDVIPAGDYIASIEGAELKDTKNGDGKYLSISLSIIKPTNEGRRLWDNLNLQNKSEKAVIIAKARLKEYLGALGMERIKNPAELLSGVVGVRVGVKADRNEIKKIFSYKEIKETTTAKTAVPAPSPASPVSAPKRASWAS